MLIRNHASLATTPQREIALQIVNSGLEACRAEEVIGKMFLLEGDILSIKGGRYDLRKFRDIYLIGFGKMSAEVARNIEKVVPIKKGFVIDTVEIKLKKIKVFKGTHPLPSRKNVNATKKIIDFVEDLGKGDLLLCIVSGGGSSLLCYPNIPFKEYTRKLKKVIYSGIDVHKLNQFRRRYSSVKGGKLAAMIHPAKLINLYFSDVIGDNLSTIASGPTFDKKADNILLLNNKTALDAMSVKAKSLGLRPRIVSSRLRGEARNAGKRLLRKVDGKNTCLLAGGETTVTVKGKGKGGRNQELCLGCLDAIGSCTLASIDSDGIDGVTDRAGVIIDMGTKNKAEKLKLNVGDYLKTNDSHHFFKKTGGLVHTGKTGVNVMDFVVVVK